jgi:hypothetical protein
MMNSRVGQAVAHQASLVAPKFLRIPVLGALCLGLRVRAVASIHFGGETRLGGTAAQPSDPAFSDAHSRRIGL